MWRIWLNAELSSRNESIRQCCNWLNPEYARKIERLESYKIEQEKINEVT